MLPVYATKLRKCEQTIQSINNKIKPMLATILNAEKAELKLGSL